MIPLADHNPTHKAPLVTWGLMAACIIAFIYQMMAGDFFEQIVGEYGFIPYRLLGGADEHWDGENFPTAPWVTVFSSMFLHGDVTHIAGNMLYLWVFGDNIEQALGKVKFFAFYLLCGVAAALTQGFIDPVSTVPMIGASGAISGVLGAYMVLHPRQKVTVAMPYVGITQLPALVVLGMWFVYQLVYGLAAGAGGGGVAFWAHIGGFMAGVVGIVPFRHRPKPQLWE